MDCFAFISEMMKTHPRSAKTSERPRPRKSPPRPRAEPVLSALTDGDEEPVATAGYLLALVQDRTGIQTVIRYWRNTANTERARLVYRSVAALNDDTRTPVLEEIYSSTDKND